MNSLANAIAELEALERQHDGSNIYLAVRVASNETIVAGNPAGIAHLALQLLRVSQRGFNGAHFHLDAATADIAETSAVFVLEEPVWGP